MVSFRYFLEPLDCCFATRVDNETVAIVERKPDFLFLGINDVFDKLRRISEL